MRINIKKYNSKTYSQKDHWGKGPTKQKDRKPLFKKETFYTVKKDIIKERQKRLILKDYSGEVKIDLQNISDLFLTEEQKNLFPLWTMHAELETVFLLEKEDNENSLGVFTFSSSFIYPVVKIKNKNTGEMLNVQLYSLKVVEPTSEEVQIELMNRELNK